ATSDSPLGGDNIKKNKSNGLRTTTEEAKEIKKEHGHAYYPNALEDETFEATIIGSNQKEVYNQLEISDMIEARLEELLRLIEKEIERMGFYEVRGGYVL